MSTWRVFLLSVLLSMSSLLPSFAAAPVVEQWAATLKETSALLRDGHFEDARTRLERLKREMFGKIGPGEASDRLFAIVVGELAVAQAGSGQTENAIWNWQVAQNLDPAIRQMDLSGYGSAGALLTAKILPLPPEQCARPVTEARPLIRKRVEPKYPEGARQFRESGIVIVQIRLDKDGRPLEPQVIKGLAAPITDAALDALREWRFEPPNAEDPVASAPFCVTFNFKLR